MNRNHPNPWSPPFNIAGGPTWVAGGEYRQFIDPSDVDVIKALFRKVRASQQDQWYFLTILTGSKLVTTDTLSVAAGRVVADKLKQMEYQNSVRRIIAEKYANGDEPLD